MEYEKKDGKVVGKLSVQNVDTGAGLERLSAVLQGKKTAYDTDLFLPIIEQIRSLGKIQDQKSERIIADHIRSAVFMVADGVIPSNADRGYVLRRLLRRALLNIDKLGLQSGSLSTLVSEIIKIYGLHYSEIIQNESKILEEILKEEDKFKQTLSQGLKEFEHIAKVSTGEIAGEIISKLYTTYGFPFELTKELALARGLSVDEVGYREELKKHQELSRTASAGMFKGGLANHGEKTVKLHTAHHLLLSALQEVLGKDVKQRGSNITEERLRIDFSFERKLTQKEIVKVESIVNQRISDGLDVIRKEMPLTEAETLGAEMEFGAKYPDIVSVYFVQDKSGNVISKEFCGGPHVSNTGVLGTFKIQKEEAVSAGVRRIKATLS